MCKKSRQKDKMGIMEKINENKTKEKNSFLLHGKHKKTDSKVQEVGFSNFRERVCDFSLDFPVFGQSVRFGPRSKVVLCGEGYSWAPILWSSDNSKR